MVLSRLQVFGEEAVRYGGKFLIAGIPLALIPGVANLRNAQPFLL